MQGEVGEHGQKGGKGAKGEHVSQTGSWQLTWYQTVQGDCSCRCWSGSVSVLLRLGSSWSTWTNGSCWSAWRCCKYDIHVGVWQFVATLFCILNRKKKLVYEKRWLCNIKMETFCGAGCWRRAWTERTTGSFWIERWWRIQRIPRSTWSYWTSGKIIVTPTFIQIIIIFLNLINHKWKWNNIFKC